MLGRPAPAYTRTAALDQLLRPRKVRLTISVVPGRTGLAHNKRPRVPGPGCR